MTGRLCTPTGRKEYATFLNAILIEMYLRITYVLHYSQRSRDRRSICGVLQRSISAAIAERTVAGPQWTATRSCRSPADWTTVSHALFTVTYLRN